MSPAELIFDKHAALERMAFDAQLFHEMIDLLREDGPRRMNELWAAQQNGDFAGAHYAAHSLKGLAANFSAGPTVQAALRAEQLAKAGDGQQLPGAAAELSQALDTLLAELARHALPPVQADVRTGRRENAAPA